MSTWKRTLTAGIGCVVLGWSNPASVEATDPVDLMANIPVASADDNAETSAGVTKILQLCADAYKNLSAAQAEGTYVHASKTEKDGETTFSTAKVSLSYLRPDKLAIVSDSDDEDLDCAFYADGTTATHISTEDKSYVVLPQPDSLSAYAENYRNGEILEEYSGALSFSVTGPLMISESPFRWLHEDVSQYIYEGKENVNDVSCHRVRFIQVNPDIIVIIWVNEKTWLIDKISFINSLDEDYNRVESFEEGDVASMSIMTWDNLSTDPKKIDNSAFKAVVPRGFELTPDKPGESGDDQKSWWDSIVGLAAEESPQETTWSLTRQTGKMELTLRKFATIKPPIVDMEAIPADSGQPTALAVASEDGDVVLFSQDGSESGSLELKQKLDSFTVALAETSQPLYLVSDKTKFALSAFNKEGELLWSYHHPYTSVNAVSVAQLPETGVYVGLSGDAGVRKLNLRGEVLFATSKVDYVNSLQSTPAGSNRLIVRSGQIDILDGDLRHLAQFDSEEWIGSVKWDPGKPETPIVCLAVTDDDDVLLQQRALNGDITWTAMIEPKADDVSGSAFSWVQLPVQGKVQRCGCVLLSNGTVVITSETGEVFYRGRVEANTALVKKNEDSVIVSLVPADLNGDGIDEVYTRMGEHLMQLSVAE